MSAGLSPASPSQHQSSLTAGVIPASPLQGCMILRMELGVGGVRVEGGLDPLPPTPLRPCSNLNLRVVSSPCLALMYCTVLCCAVLCYAVQYHAVLCCVMLSCCIDAVMVNTDSITCSLTNSPTQSFTHSLDVFFPLHSGKHHGSVLAEASYNGPSPSWLGHLGPLSSVNSDYNQNNVSLAYCNCWCYCYCYHYCRLLLLKLSVLLLCLVPFGHIAPTWIFRCLNLHVAFTDRAWKLTESKQPDDPPPPHPDPYPLNVSSLMTSRPAA